MVLVKIILFFLAFIFLVILGLYIYYSTACIWTSGDCDYTKQCRNKVLKCSGISTALSHSCTPDISCQPKNCIKTWSNYKCYSDASPSEQEICTGSPCLSNNNCMIQTNQCDATNQCIPSTNCQVFHCLSHPTTCNYTKKCRNWIDSCTGASTGCINSSGCISPPPAKYKWPANTRGVLNIQYNLFENFPQFMIKNTNDSLTNYDLPRFVLWSTVLKEKSSGYTIMDNNGRISYTDITVTPPVIYYLVYTSGDPFMSTNISSATLFQYNDQTGQIVDNMENPSYKLVLKYGTPLGETSKYPWYYMSVASYDATSVCSGNGLLCDIWSFTLQ